MTSVIIPVYNGAGVLPRTLYSVIANNSPSELLYVNDGSADGTADLLAAAAHKVPRLQVVTLGENRGRAAARNAGVAAARGDVLVFLDADVEPGPNAVEALAEAVRQPGAVAAVARLAPVPDHPADPFQDYLAHHPRGPHPDLPPLASVDWRYFVTTACAVRRDAFEAAGGFPEGIRYGEDTALACRLASAHPAGLRLADATVRLHDLGDLSRALRHAAEFGRATRHLAEACADGPLGPLLRARRLAPVARSAAPALRAIVRRMPPGRFRRKAVRYLLASTALAATRRA